MFQEQFQDASQNNQSVDDYQNNTNLVTPTRPSAAQFQALSGASQPSSGQPVSPAQTEQESSQNAGASTGFGLPQHMLTRPALGWIIALVCVVLLTLCSCSFVVTLLLSSTHG